MNNQLELGKQLRDQALASMEIRKSAWITMCRKFAIQHANRTGSVSINDVRACFELPAGFHPNVWGCILKCKELEAVGYTQASHKDAHARVVRVFGIKKL